MPCTWSDHNYPFVDFIFMIAIATYTAQKLDHDRLVSSPGDILVVNVVHTSYIPRGHGGCAQFPSWPDPFSRVQKGAGHETNRLPKIATRHLIMDKVFMAIYDAQILLFQFFLSVALEVCFTNLFKKAN